VVEESERDGMDGAVPITLGLRSKPVYDECPTEVSVR
jgi:hypothetical protein